MPRLKPLGLYVALLLALSVLRAPAGTLADEGEPEAAARLEAIQQAFQQVIERVSPAVVGVRARRPYLADLPRPGDGGQPRPFAQVVLVNASGTVLTADGLILTNQHVIQSASDIQVLFWDGRALPATVVAADARCDLAVLRVARRGLSPVRFCDWSRVARGQWAITLGNPYGLGGDGQLSAAVGVISNLDRRLPGLGEADDRLYHDMIQTTAPINPGNSGGPLFNIRGELIGIVTAMHTRGAADEGVGFAIPMTPQRRRLIDQLARGQRIDYGYLGLTVRVPLERERRAAGTPRARGVVVQRVQPDGPAARAEIRPGDLIVAYDGRPLRGPADLAERVGATPVGRQVALVLYRGPQRLTIRLTVQRRRASHRG